MQVLGGTKGANVFSLASLLEILGQVLQQAPGSVGAAINQTSLSTLTDVGEYVLYRSAAPDTPGAISVNIRNNIAENDESQTPRQFVYEAADCRIWWTPEMILAINAVWETVADVAWDINGTQPLSEGSGCVKGSTKQPSILSGDAALDAGGKPANVTVGSGMAGENANPPTSTLSGGATTSTANAAARRPMNVKKASLGALNCEHRALYVGFVSERV